VLSGHVLRRHDQHLSTNRVCRREEVLTAFDDGRRQRPRRLLPPRQPSATSRATSNALMSSPLRCNAPTALFDSALWGLRMCALIASIDSQRSVTRTMPGSLMSTEKAYLRHPFS